MRIWTTGVEPNRVDEYRSFALERSLPMFCTQNGFLGVLFTEAQARFAVISLWKDRMALEALERSESYRSTVNAIISSGFLTGNQNIEVFEVNSGYIDGSVVDITRNW